MVGTSSPLPPVKRIPSLLSSVTWMAWGVTSMLFHIKILSLLVGIVSSFVICFLNSVFRLHWWWPSRGRSRHFIPWSTGSMSIDMRRYQIRVKLECGAKIKFLAASFQPMTLMSNYQSAPWTRSFQNMYTTVVSIDWLLSYGNWAPMSPKRVFWYMRPLRLLTLETCGPLQSMWNWSNFWQLRSTRMAG